MLVVTFVLPDLSGASLVRTIKRGDDQAVTGFGTTHRSAGAVGESLLSRGPIPKLRQKWKKQLQDILSDIEITTVISDIVH